MVDANTTDETEEVEDANSLLTRLDEERNQLLAAQNDVNYALDALNVAEMEELVPTLPPEEFRATRARYAAERLRLTRQRTEIGTRLREMKAETRDAIRGDRLVGLQEEVRVQGRVIRALWDVIADTDGLMDEIAEEVGEEGRRVLVRAVTAIGEGTGAGAGGTAAATG